jgi:hypothetical protein
VSIAIGAAILAGIAMLGHRKHNEVLQLTTEANIRHTQASDVWNEYQAVNIRDHEYRFAGGVLTEVSKAEPRYAPGLKSFIDDAEKQHKKYDVRLPELKTRAEGLVKQGEDRFEESHLAHHQADRLDYAHVGAEIGIVLSSLALLTKRRGFWVAGMAATILAIALVVSTYLLPHPAHGESHDSHDSAPARKDH